MTVSKKRRFDRKIILIEHQALKEIRLELGLTLKEAGKKLGVSEKTIGAIENGRISLGKNKIEEIMNLYGVPLLEFIRAKRIIKRNGHKKRKRKTIKRVLSNSDRRSYQKVITKECKVLKSLRRMKKISQDNASKLCGYPRASIGHIENGRIELSKERIEHIVRSYGYAFLDYEDALEKAEQRDSIIDSCIEKIEQLGDDKLNLVKGILASF